MQDDDRLNNLPEAIPLHRIAPFWRLFAIVAVVAAVALLFVVLILCIVLVNLHNRSPIYAPVPPPVYRAPPMAPGVVVGGGGPSVEDEDSPEPQNLPYPVKADLAGGDPHEPVAEDPSPPTKPPPTARERFLDKGTDVWKLK